MYSKAYDYEEFRQACKDNKVIPTDKTLRTCKAFNLETKEELLDLIAEDGFDVRVYYDTQKWGENPYPTDLVLVDSYHFLTGERSGTVGYMAFMKTKHRETWSLKSFHIDHNPLVECQNGKIIYL